MKRFIAIMMIIFVLVLAASCGQPEPIEAPDASAEETEAPVSDIDESASAQDSEGGEAYSQIAVGFSLGGEGAFYDQLKADIESECEALNYRAEIKTAATAEEQIEQIHTMVSTGISMIALDPVDVDALESVLAECETNHVPVINIIDSINGRVSTLISPDYISIGKSAGRDAVALYGETKGECMMVKTDYGSFTMQLMSDGFDEEIGQDDDVTIVCEAYCDDNEENAYEAVKAELENSESTVNFVFAQSEKMGTGALRAIEESGKSVSLVVFGGDMALVSAAAEGKVHSCIFFGTQALVKETMKHADQFIKNDGYAPPQFIELRIEAAEGADAAQYVQDGLTHAQIVG